MADLFFAAAAEHSTSLVQAMINRAAGPAVEGGSGTPGAVTAIDNLAAYCYCHDRTTETTVQYTASETYYVFLIGTIYDATSRMTNAASELIRCAEHADLESVSDWNGSFAAIIVTRASGRIDVLSDRFSSRPLFLQFQNGNLVVSSRLEAVISSKPQACRLSSQGMAELITYQRTVYDHTQYHDVHSLPAAAHWTFEGCKRQTRQTRNGSWNRPDFSEAEGGERLAQALTAAATRRIPEGGAGMLMSGGLDSRLVLAAARKAGRQLRCYSSSPVDSENLEISIAARVAATAGFPFEAIYNAPSRLPDVFDPSVRASHGLFAAPINLFGVLEKIAGRESAVLSGHGLDYTFRGYYLPCTILEVMGSRTRLPRLNRIPDGTPKTVDSHLRVGISRNALERCMAPEFAKAWPDRRLRAMEASQTGMEISDPYNAWDSFILHALGRHYAWSDFAAMSSFFDHQTLTFDKEVIDLYFSMPPDWRANGKMAQQAMRHLGEDLLQLPDANSGIKASYNWNLQIAMIIGRAALRRLGILKRPMPPSDPLAGHGSWVNHGLAFMTDHRFIERLQNLGKSEALFDTGLFSSEGVKAVVDEHLSGAHRHTKLLHELMTIDSMLKQFGYSGVVDD